MSEENTEPGIEDNKPNSNGFVDKVTLELLMNKNHYNRYISQTDPKKHQEYLDHLAKMKKYRSKIMNITIDFLDDSKKQVTTEINEAFDYYVRTIVRHLECTDIENPDGFKQDEDTMFGNMDDNREQDIFEEPSSIKSYWGKSKVVKNLRI